MIVRIQNGIKIWQGDTLPNRLAERPEIRNYQLRTDLHAVDGFCDTQNLIVVPEGYVLTAESWSIVDGVAVQAGILRLISDVEAERAAAEKAAAVAHYIEALAVVNPILPAHPAEADVPTGGMQYRLPDLDDPTIITWWVVRDDDKIAQQISSHRADGTPVHRSVDLRTRVMTEFDFNEIVEGLKDNASKAKAKKTSTI